MTLSNTKESTIEAFIECHISGSAERKAEQAGQTRAEFLDIYQNLITG